MSYNKFNTRIEIVQTKTEKDAEGFGVDHDEVLANVRAYREKQRGSKFWASRVAQFERANRLFQFRRIPGLEITTKMAIIADGRRHDILHVDDTLARGAYVEVLAESIEPSRR